MKLKAQNHVYSTPLFGCSEDIPNTKNRIKVVVYPGTKNKEYVVAISSEDPREAEEYLLYAKGDINLDNIDDFYVTHINLALKYKNNTIGALFTSRDNGEGAQYGIQLVLFEKRQFTGVLVCRLMPVGPHRLIEQKN